MEPASCCLSRLPLSGKFWLKRALVDAALLTGDTPPPDPDGRLLADIRVEAGRIRAVLPAGEAPCCSPDSISAGRRCSR
ncbi:hypothetical protein [Azospirillum thermophilum]|uniref:Uncharacterized protein n=1 Tax=Azospirillum thermophilum TaxID=2202148 RepID=A0A2S2CW89_9PROT|nr:hypothetical protein [Azospirillum thermophilum]AWK88736.1 hypothetical protein DEW08_21865 [Azospirillum thermophilum]